MTLTKLARNLCVLVLAFVASSSGATSSSFAEETVNPALFSEVKWRGIGPYRGGRALAVAGVKGNPQLYYMGAAGGEGVENRKRWRYVAEYF